MDLHSNLTIRLALQRTELSGDTSIVGEPISTVGHAAVEFIVEAHGLAPDTQLVPSVLHGFAEDGSDAVPSDAVVGTQEQSAFSGKEDAGVKRMGYIGGRPYVRLVLDVRRGKGEALAFVVLGGARQTPA